MKKINELLKQAPIYKGEFKNEFCVFNEFSYKYYAWDSDELTEEEKQELIKEFDGVTVLFASYSHECYEGEAFVLFEKNGELFEVNGGHCSCYGLEGQWEPEKVNIEVMANTLTNGTKFEYSFDPTVKTDLIKFLGVNNEN